MGSYEVVAYTPTDVFLVYLTVSLAAVITYPILMVIAKAIGGAADRWK